MDKLKRAKYFTKLDVRWGYNNVRIRKGDEWKAAFKPVEDFSNRWSCFLIFTTNIPSNDGCHLCRHDRRMHRHNIMDDILIFARTQEDFEKYTKLVLQRLRENDLFLKAMKCEFNKTRVEYLGMIVEEGKIAMDPLKLGGIRDWPTPTTVKQVRSFLGFGNFYRRFIHHFSELARPLNDLTKKDKKFEWTEECQNTFDTLKRKFTEEPVLMMPDH